MNDFIARQGWQCPLCKTVYSLDTPCCWYCGAAGITKTSTDGRPTFWVKRESTTDIGGYTFTLKEEEK